MLDKQELIAEDAETVFTALEPVHRCIFFGVNPRPTEITVWLKYNKLGDCIVSWNRPSEKGANLAEITLLKEYDSDDIRTVAYDAVTECFDRWYEKNVIVQREEVDDHCFEKAKGKI